MMNFKVIDCKLKEVYCELRPVEEKKTTIQKRENFWNTMELIAMQNITLQQLKMA